MAALGVRVMPLQPGAKAPVKGVTFDTATRDPDTIRNWFGEGGKFEGYNYACLGGEGLVILDIDPPKGGWSSFSDLGLDIQTFTVKAPGGGVHLYMTGPDVATTTDRVGKGLDVRGRNGYVVGPGSYYADRGRKKGYTGHWIVLDDKPFQACPEPLVLMAGPPGQRDDRPPVSVDDPADIARARHYLEHDAPRVTIGDGANNQTYKTAAHLVEYGISLEEAIDLMRDTWNPLNHTPLKAYEIESITRNAFAYSRARQGEESVHAAGEGFGEAAVIDDGWQPVIAPPPPPIDWEQEIAPGLIPLDQIPKRDWVGRGLALRRETSLIIGPGAASKSALCIAIAVHAAVGKSFGPWTFEKPLRSVLYNREDSRAEMSARVYAACAKAGIDPAAVASMLTLWSSADGGPLFKVMGKDHIISVKEIDQVAARVKALETDLLFIDPMVSTHHEDENDNVAMADVMQAFRLLAIKANVGLPLVQHTPKGSRARGSADAARGASNIVNSVRVAWTVYSADEEDAKAFALPSDYRAKYLRVDDAKSSYQPLSSSAIWFERSSFDLPNGDQSYGLIPFKVSASQKAEGDLMAEILYTHLDYHSMQRIGIHDAAKVLADNDPYFREKVDGRNYNPLKLLITLHLSTPRTLANGWSIKTKMLTNPRTQRTEEMVEIDPPGGEFAAATTTEVDWDA